MIRSILFTITLLLVMLGCSFLLSEKSTTGNKSSNSNQSTSITDTVFFNNNESEQLIYYYKVIDNMKILRKIIRRKKMTIVEYRGSEFRNIQEIYFNEKGLFTSLINVKSIIPNDSLHVIEYHRDKFKLDKDGRYFREVFVSDSTNIILDLYRFENKILDMTRGGNYGVPVYDYTLKKPSSIKIDSIK